MKEILEKRKIRYLLHFTQAQNLPNILRYGLLPKSIIEGRKIKSSFNDNYRYDRCIDAVCASIEFPNYKMFYKLRQENLDTEWVVLLLDAKILCDFECAYCYTNAGSAQMYNVPLVQRKGEEAFLHLFDDSPNGNNREKLGIREHYPTNPQAEVLVFGSIQVKYIVTVFFENDITLDKYKKYIPNSIKAKTKSAAFERRIDSKYW